MIRIAVCDDQKWMRDSIINRIEAERDRIKVNVEVSEFTTGEDLLFAIDDREKIDIIFLDIEMSGMNGIETAKIIKSRNPFLILIFVSGYEEHMYSAFDARPFGFLKKPVEEERFGRLFEEACTTLMDLDNEVLSFQYEKKFFTIPYSQILYFESSRRKICIHTRQGLYCFYGKLDKLQNSLRHSQCTFLRVHKSYLINMHHVLQMEYEKVTMKNGDILSISKDKRKITRIEYIERRGKLWIS